MYIYYLLSYIIINFIYMYIIYTYILYMFWIFNIIISKNQCFFFIFGILKSVVRGKLN